MSLLQKSARRVAGMLGRQSRLVSRLRPAYESLLDWSNDGGGIEWTINGVAFRIDPRYRHRMGEHYDAEVAAFLAERVERGAVCCDVGANVGVYVLQFAHWTGAAGRVVAFEPNPTALDILRKHVRLNELDARVTVVPAAVAETSGEAVLYAAEADGMSRLGEANRAIAARVSEIDVPVVALDDFCRAEGLAPDWLFIDIEGFELAALAGARRLIKERGAKLRIVVEMHPNVWDSAGTTRDGAESLFAELRLRAVPLTGQADPLGEHGLVYLEHQ